MATENKAATAEARPYRKVRRGLVVSDKMDKTITVKIESRIKHPLYGKVMSRSSKVKAHDENNTAGIGDLSSSWCGCDARRLVTDCGVASGRIWCWAASVRGRFTNTHCGRGSARCRRRGRAA